MLLVFAPQWLILEVLSLDPLTGQAHQDLEHVKAFEIRAITVTFLDECTHIGLDS